MKGEKTKGVLVFSITKDDFRFETFRSGGKGGQNQNKVESGIRLIHKPSGATAECREERSQLANKRKAFRKLIDLPKYKAWFSLECARRMLNIKQLQEINRQVDEMMQESNLRIEFL